MINEKIELRKYYNVQGGTLTVYSMDYPYKDPNNNFIRPAMVVVPGGAYAFCSKREGEPAVFEYLSKGYQVFLLDYLCAPTRYPEQLLELACSVDYIKKNASKYSVDKENVFAVGFSAGGHLVANLSVNNGAVEKYYKDNLDYKLKASVLCYPVISEEYIYTGTHENLLGGLDNKELVNETDLDKQVNKDTVPSFIWSTFKDTLVPCQNAMNYALKLKEHNIEFELHIYPEGGHGLSVCSLDVCPDQPCLKKNSNWINESDSFLKTIMNR